MNLEDEAVLLLSVYTSCEIAHVSVVHLDTLEGQAPYSVDAV